MSKKLWGYVVRVFITDSEGTPLETFRFESIGISPYKHTLGSNMEKMESEVYDNLRNPMAIANFINSIGDKNTLTVKKRRDLKSSALKQFYDNKESLYGIRLDIAPLAHVPANLKGDARLNKLFAAMLESVALKDVSVESFFTFAHPSTSFDLITFQCKEVTFQFE